MTDLYIEQATTAFQQLWTGGGQLSTTMPQLNEVIQSLAGRLRTTESALQLATQRMDAQDALIGKLRDDLLKVQTVSEGSSRRLEHLEGESGVLCKAELFAEVRQMPEVDSIRSMREQLLTLHQRVGETSGELLERQRHLEERLPDIVERCVGEANRQVKLQVTRMEEDHQNSVQRLTSSISKINTSVSDSQAFCSRELRNTQEHLDQQIRDVKESAQHELEVSFTEVLTHLKQQAQIVDGMQTDMRKHHEAALTQEQVEQLREEMRTVRGDMDRAQFRLHEAYSQMMSLARTGGTFGGSGGGNYADSAKPVPPSVGPSPAADTSSSRGPGPLSNSLQWSALAAPSAAFLESSLEPIRRELSTLQRSVIPALSTAIQSQQESTDGLVAMHRRAQNLLHGLMSCVGLRDRLDELFSSIEAMDAAHVLLMLRKGFDAVYPPHVLAQRAGRNGGHTDHVHSSADPSQQRAGPYTPMEATPIHHSTSPYVASPAAAASGTPSGGRHNSSKHHHTPLHYRGADGPQKRFQLGVDVADTPEGLGARIMSVVEGSVAQRHGLRTGEIVLRVNGQPVESANHFAMLMRSEERSLEATLHSGTQQAYIALLISYRGSSGVPATRVVDIPVG